jgi:membrane fusion protein, multidrug efflux system
MPEEAAPSRVERIRQWRAAHPRATWLIWGGLAVAVVVAVALWLHLRTYVSTDDAQIDADISSISARVSGVVTAVRVVDNQYVHAGDVLAELDPADFQVAVARAEASLAQARAQTEAQLPSLPITTTTTQTSRATSAADVEVARSELTAAERDVDSARARVAQAEAQARLAAVDYQRSVELRATNAVAQVDLDQHTAARDSANAELTAARAALESAKKRVDQHRERVAQAQSRLGETEKNAPKEVDIQAANIESRKASVKDAEAALEQAKLNLAYARIVAPVSGVVGRKSVNIGNHVTPGQQLLVIVQVDHLWVTANFKETQIHDMHPGQRARVGVDAYGVELDATVESMPGASGSRFSLFPPENATGNYVKVVQRLPVRLRILPNQRRYDELRPGMSVEPKVYIR